MSYWRHPCRHNLTSAIAKLNKELAAEIREEYALGKTTFIVLANKYGVSKKTILNIVHNKIYKG